MDFLESLIVADVRGLGENRACLSLFLTEKGTILDDTMVTRHANEINVVVNAGCAEKDWKHLTQQAEQWKAKGKDVQLIDLQKDNALIAVQGPEAAAALIKALDKKGPGYTDAEQKVKDTPFLSAFRGNVFGRPAYISRCGYTGEDGFEVSCCNEETATKNPNLT